MRRLMPVLVAGSLLGTICFPAMSQEPTAPPSFGGRVELPDRGVAVTFPRDWMTFDLGDDIGARVESIESGLGDVFPAGRDAMVADLERRSESSELLGLSLHEQACDLRLLSSRRVDLLGPAFQAQLDAAIGAEQGIVDYTGVGPVDLPSGPAITYSWVQVGADAQGRDLPHTGYMVDGGVRGVVLTCEGTERPDDDWLSIAETIEFLAKPEPPALVGIGGRVELPQDGFVLTFPADWVWARTSEFGTDVLVDRLGDLTDPGYAEDYRALLSEVEGIWPLVGWPLVGGEECRVGVYPTAQQLDELVAGLLEIIEANDAIYPDGASVIDLELRGIDVVRLDYTHADPEFPSPSAGSHYVWAQQGTYYYVACLGDSAPADHWLSVAETLEFLSAQEG